MTCVGNDVVDLDDACHSSAHRRERFEARVCSASERALLDAAADRHALVWALFAAKEAAYKAVCKLGPRPVFAHRQFIVGARLDTIDHGARRFHVAVEGGAGFVHALVWLGDAAPSGRVERVEPGADPSQAARSLLIRSAGLEGLTVRRDPAPGSWDGYLPPRLWRHGSPLARDVSLSHDGRFVACALAPA